MFELPQETGCSLLVEFSCLNLLNISFVRDQSSSLDRTNVGPKDPDYCHVGEVDVLDRKPHDVQGACDQSGSKEAFLRSVLIVWPKDNDSKCA